MSDARFMALALALGRRGLGQTWPNPAVGCVIVKAGRIVGRGATQPGGRPHAEVIALAQAGQAARGATAFVTLEPCSHHGKTPPCADALVAAGVAPDGTVEVFILPADVATVRDTFAIEMGGLWYDVVGLGAEPPSMTNAWYAVRLQRRS